MADPRFFSNYGPFQLGEILDACQISKNKFDVKKNIKDTTFLKNGNIGDLSFIDDTSLVNDLKNTKSEFCFISEKYFSYAPKSTTLIPSENPRKSFAIAANLFYPNSKNIHNIYKDESKEKNNSISSSAILSESAHISSGVTIGKKTFIGPNVVIGNGVIIGDNCYIHSNVTITHSIMGNSIEILPGARIGQDGFGFVPGSSVHLKIPQLGRVIIGDDVNIGSNTTIDRGSGPDTVIGNSCFIDNLVHIAHNVKLGKGCIIAGQVGIAGSSKLGDYIMIAGQSGISGHLNIGSGSKFAVKSGVINDIPAGEVTYGGFPAVPIRDWHRQTLSIKNISKKRKGKKNV